MIVVGAPLDFRLGYGSFGPKEAPAQVVHVADAPAGIATHCTLAAIGRGRPGPRSSPPWPRTLAGHRAAGAGADWLDPDWRAAGSPRPSRRAADAPLLASDADPVHPMRIYGELLKVLDDDAVVIGDGGDFVSFAQQYRRAGPAGRLA